MNLDFLKLPASEQRIYFQQAAIQRNISPVIVEKDFWVCWLLSILFKSEFADSIVFKGGTSLSKVFGAIDRFSEDIDLSLSPAFLGLPEPGTSRTQAGKWMKRAETDCQEAIKTRIIPALESKVFDILNKNESVQFEFVKDPSTNSPVLLFHYPSNEPSGFDYINRSVKLEFGSLTDQQPAGTHSITPWIAETFPSAFPDWQCKVVALEIERSFWEKVTILHAEYHRPLDKPIRDRFSRHYADTAALFSHPKTVSAINHYELRKRVVLWKSLFFGSSWANYDQAKPGTFRLIPKSERLPSLRRDYQLMRDMYLSEPLNFDEILSKIADLESRINQEYSD